MADILTYEDLSRWCRQTGVYKRRGNGFVRCSLQTAIRRRALDVGPFYFLWADDRVTYVQPGRRPKSVLRDTFVAASHTARIVRNNYTGAAA